MDINQENFLLELRQKNPLAIEFIVRQYGPLMKKVIRQYLYDSHEAFEECFNDVLLAVWNNPDRFDDKKSEFKNWLCAIAKYRAIDTLRREQKRKERFVSLENEADLDHWERLAVSEGQGEEADRSAVELEKLLGCLSEEDKDLFFRRYVNEQSVEEISKEKNMKRSLIYARISRGKKKIKRHMECRMGGEVE